MKDKERDGVESGLRSPLSAPLGAKSARRPRRSSAARVVAIAAIAAGALAWCSGPRPERRQRARTASPGQIAHEAERAGASEGVAIPVEVIETP